MQRKSFTKLKVFQQLAKISDPAEKEKLPKHPKVSN
jgi:hypothetical protein